jgi:hypothetical protein
MSVVFEDSLVSIVRAGGVSIAYPHTMTRFELATVLHGLVGALFSGEIAASAEARPAAPVDTSRVAGLEVTDAPQSPQGANRLTNGDRRGLPRKKVVKRSRNGKRETLSCGHVIDPVPSNWKEHRSRACEQCAVATA